MDDYDGTNEALIPIASFLLQPATSLSFHMYFHTIFIRPAPMYVLAEFLSTNFFAHQFWLSPHRDILWALLRFQDPSASSFTVIGLHINHQPLLESLYEQAPTRHPAPVFACCPKSVYHESQGNFTGAVLLRPYIFRLKLIRITH